MLDAVRAGGQVKPEEMPQVVGRISFFCNAGIRFIEEMCKMRAFGVLWDRITEQRYGVKEAEYRRFRYGVQVNSLGLTEPQPENNIIRIVLEMLAVSISKDARARAIQLPAWNEALGLPRPWDQQWSLRAQQILAYESDLLGYGDIFDGSHVIEQTVNDMVAEASREVDDILSRGGAIQAVESGYLKQRLVESNAARIAAIERGEQVVVGVNKFIETAQSPLTKDLDGAILTVEASVEQHAIEAIKQWRAQRDAGAAQAALQNLRDAVRKGENIMPPSIAAAKAGVTTGEWGATLRDALGEYRAPTGVAGARIRRRNEPGRSRAHRRAARRSQPARKAPRPTAQAAGRKARARRSQQRRRADRAQGARRRLRGRVRRHPRQPGTAGRFRARGRRTSDRHLDPERLAPRARAADREARARGRTGRCADRRRRHHSGSRCAALASIRRCARVHAEGLRVEHHHG